MQIQARSDLWLKSTRMVLASPTLGLGDGELFWPMGHRKEIYGSDLKTTNSRMELMAAIMALEATMHCQHLHSEYLRDGITSWIHTWKRNNWRTADKKSVKNVELWKCLDEALGEPKIRWKWIKDEPPPPPKMSAPTNSPASRYVRCIRAGA